MLNDLVLAQATRSIGIASTNNRSSNVEDATETQHLNFADLPLHYFERPGWKRLECEFMVGMETASFIWLVIQGGRLLHSNLSSLGAFCLVEFVGLRELFHYL
jgi:hypothetical protein